MTARDFLLCSCDDIFRSCAILLNLAQSVAIDSSSFPDSGIQVRNVADQGLANGCHSSASSTRTHRSHEVPAQKRYT